MPLISAGGFSYLFQPSLLPLHPSAHPCCCCSRSADKRSEAWLRPAAVLPPSSNLSSSPCTRPGRRAAAAAGPSWTLRRPCEWRRAQTSCAGRPRWFLPGRGKSPAHGKSTRRAIKIRIFVIFIKGFLLYPAFDTPNMVFRVLRLLLSHETEIL